MTQTTLDDNAVASRIDGFRLRRTPCCTSLYNEDNKPVLALNATSALIWENCGGELTVRRMIDEFHAAFEDVDYQELETDIVNVLSQFHQEGVITLA